MSFTSILADIHIDNEFVDWARKYYSEVKAHELKATKSIAVSLQGAIDGVQKKLDGLFLMRANGEISATEYSTTKSRLQSELEAFMMQAKADVRDSGDWESKSIHSFDIAYLASETFKAKPEERKPLLREINSNLFLDHGLVKPVLKKPYFLFSEMKKDEMLDKKQFEPVKESYLTTQTLAFARANPLKYPVPDSHVNLKRFTVLTSSNTRKSEFTC